MNTNENDLPVLTRQVINNTADSVSRNQTPYALARVYAGPPVAGRRLWLVVALTCPLCDGGMHAHRVADYAALAAGDVQRLCPVVRKPYALRPVPRGHRAAAGRGEVT